MNNWLKLVEVYTHRQVTVATDRILAISGIAERYGRAFGDQYCAGLWRSGFPRALFWTHSDKMQPRPRVWQGPSWSWTSIAGPVKFPVPSLMDEDSSSILHFDRVANRLTTRSIHVSSKRSMAASTRIPKASTRSPLKGGLGHRPWKRLFALQNHR